MTFILAGTEYFYKQLDTLSQESKELVAKKLELLKENPYRFKKLYSKTYKLFRIRLSLDGKESWLIYSVVEPNVILLCLLERKRGYKELERIVKRLLR